MMTMHERLSSPHFCCGVTFFRKADMRAHTKEVSEREMREDGDDDMMFRFTVRDIPAPGQAVARVL